MKWIDYIAPSSVNDALNLMASTPSALPLVGGTDLLVQLRSGRRTTGLVVDIKRIPEFNELSFNEMGLTLGAAVPCYRIYEDSKVVREHPALAEIAGIIGGTLIQGRASLGGNLCNAAPSADSVPLLIALGAICRIAGIGGQREVLAEEFCTGPGTNVLRRGELLVSFLLPPVSRNFGACYLRFIPRNEMDIAVAGAGVSVTLKDGYFADARIALASVAPTPLFVREAGRMLVGRRITDETVISAAAELASGAAQPITDMRAAANYRRHLCAVLTRRALKSAIERAQEK